MTMLDRDDLPVPLAVTGLLPPLIADAGEQVSRRYIDFFTADIRNPNTRRAYARSCGTLLVWCETPGRAGRPVAEYRAGGKLIQPLVRLPCGCHARRI